MSLKNYEIIFQFYEITYKVKQFFAVPGKANQPEQINATSSSISLSWNHVVEGNLTRNYTITWRPASSNNVKSISGIFGRSITITGLKSNTAYTIKLTAINEAGTGEASTATSMHTGKNISFIYN